MIQYKFSKKHFRFYTLPCFLIFSLFFITSCNGQNKSNLKEKNIVKAKQVSNNSKLNDKWANQFSIYPNNKKSLSDSASKIGEYLREIHQDKNGNLWFGTLERGVARFNGSNLVYFSKEQGLVGSQINGIAEDKEGNIWFATTEGVSKYDGKSFTNFTTIDGLSGNSTWSILSDTKGNIWIGTTKGVSKYDGNSFSNFPLPKDHIKNPTSVISKNLVWSIIEDSKGNIWFGTDGLGAIKYDGKNFTPLTQKDGLNTNDISSILEDSKGNFWFGSLETRVPTKENPYHYVSSNNGGLCRFNGKTFTQFPEINGLIAKDIGPIYEDQYGYIWIASKHNGVYRYDGEKFTNYMEQDGIAPFNCVQSILEDNKGNLWIGFSGGLFRLEGEILTNVTKDGPWK